eukprot:scaffold171836_cov13-Tisochrysis_lutea.AAC.1
MPVRSQQKLAKKRAGKGLHMWLVMASVVAKAQCSVKAAQAQGLVECVCSMGERRAAAAQMQGRVAGLGKEEGEKEGGAAGAWLEALQKG